MKMHFCLALSWALFGSNLFLAKLNVPQLLATTRGALLVGHSLVRLVHLKALPLQRL